MGGPWNVRPMGGFGNVGASGHAEGPDREVAESSHDPGPGSGSDLGFVFLIQGVAEPVQGLDRPLFPDVAGQGGGVCLPGFRAGDAECGDGRDRLAVQVRDVPFDQEHLADVRERRIVRRGQDLDGAGGNAAVALIGGGMGDEPPRPGSASRASNRARRFSFTGNTNSPPWSWMWSAVAFTGSSASAVADLPSRWILAERHRGHRHLVRLLAQAYSTLHRRVHRGGGGRAEQGRSSRTWFPRRLSRPGSPCRPA